VFPAASGSNQPTASIPSPPASHNPTAALAMAADTAAAAEEAQPEPYDGYDTDPPAHYPKPGNGIARNLRPESEDLQWLVDDNFEVFSHQANYGGEATNGNVATQLEAGATDVSMGGTS
jgi:hypothetical protein